MAPSWLEQARLYKYAASAIESQPDRWTIV
jgi:hypothetical protein